MTGCFSQNEAVIGPHGDGFPGLAVALDGPAYTNKKLSCCCDSRSYYMLQYDHQKVIRYKPVHPWFSVSQKTHVRVYFDSFCS